MKKTNKKNLAFLCMAIALGLVCSFTLGEILFRLMGHSPWQQISIKADAYGEKDPVLGWKCKPGAYSIPESFFASANLTKEIANDTISKTSSDQKITVTIEPDGNRYTGKKNVSKKNQVVCIGGSFTHGWMLSDEQTYPAKLQKKYPHWEVLNYAVQGHGTYQSLLVLERILKQTNAKMFLYGMIAHHEVRNVASFSWLKTLKSVEPQEGIKLPYCSLEKNKLRRHSPETFRKWPFCEYFSIINYFQNQYLTIKMAPRTKQQRSVTKKIILKMKQLVEKNNSKFVVVGLSLHNAKFDYIEFFKKHNIGFIDAEFPITPSYLLPDNLHPNDRATSHIAKRIVRAIEGDILALSHK